MLTLFKCIGVSSESMDISCSLGFTGETVSGDIEEITLQLSCFIISLVSVKALFYSFCCNNLMCHLAS